MILSYSMGSIFFYLLVAPFKKWFVVETYSAVQKLFNDTDTNILRMYAHVLLIL